MTKSSATYPAPMVIQPWYAYGLDGWAEEQSSATHLRVTPNLHSMASQFAMSDNFYVDGDVSNDGHRWIIGMNPTPFFNTAWSSRYGGREHLISGSSTRTKSRLRRCRLAHAGGRARIRFAVEPSPPVAKDCSTTVKALRSKETTR